MSGGKPPAGNCIVCLVDNMAHTFEFVLHFVRCDTETVSTNQIIFIIINMPMTLSCISVQALLHLHIKSLE